MKVQTRILIFILFATLLGGCSPKKDVKFSGRTMGTTYHIKLVTGIFDRTGDLKQQIDKRLEEINKSMSTYDPQSEISRFNAFREVNTPFSVSEDFYNVVHMANEIYHLSNGAWDGSIDALVNRWGFGRDAEQEMPDKKEIEQLLETTGFDNLILSDKDHALIKRKADLHIDLASIAKGYGVDEIVDVIRQNGYHNCLVEIGGEVYASGTARNGEPWRIGINTPHKDASLIDVYKVVSLQDRALATSGDYRNFFEFDGISYSHVIDPKTGYPVKNGVVSVSVQADSCAMADGLATAIMVMGHTEGLKRVNQLKDIECFIIVAGENKNISDYASENFKIME